MAGQFPVHADSRGTHEIMAAQSKFSVLNYDVKFETPAKMLTWVRAAYPNAWHFEFFMIATGMPVLGFTLTKSILMNILL